MRKPGFPIEALGNDGLWISKTVCLFTNTIVVTATPISRRSSLDRTRKLHARSAAQRRPGNSCPASVWAGLQAVRPHRRAEAPAAAVVLPRPAQGASSTSLMSGCNQVEASVCVNELTEGVIYLFRMPQGDDIKVSSVKFFIDEEDTKEVSLPSLLFRPFLYIFYTS